MTKFEDMIRCMESASDDNPVAEQQDAIDKAIEILQKLDRWCNAYPTTIFPEMTSLEWKEHHRILEKAGRSGTAAAADCMRHTVNGFKKVIHDV